MPEPSLLHIFIPRLNALEIDYMVTGAIASIIYGNPRLTHDIDVVAKLLPEHAEDVARVFPLAEFYCPPVGAGVLMDNPGPVPNSASLKDGHRTTICSPVKTVPKIAWRLRINRVTLSITLGGT